jgi:hypothetical protein
MEDIDSIVASTEESTNQEIPMGETPAQESTPQEFTHEYKFKADGKEIAVPYNDPRVQRWLEMGYSAPNRMGKLTQDLEGYKTKLSDYEKKIQGYQPFEQVDQWAKENPEKWQAVLNQVQASHGQNQSQMPPEFQQKLQGIEKFIQQVQEKEIVQRQQTADQHLDQDIKSIQEKYPNIDFKTPDQTGTSLEYKVVEHGVKSGIPSFRAAFNDYFQDKLMAMAEEKGRESAGKTLQKTKTGLMPNKVSPSQGRRAPDLKNLNYDQIEAMALAELGIG